MSDFQFAIDVSVYVWFSWMKLQVRVKKLNVPYYITRVVWLSKANVHVAYLHGLTTVLIINHYVGNGQETDSQRLKRSSSIAAITVSPYYRNNYYYWIYFKIIMYVMYYARDTQEVRITNVWKKYAAYYVLWYGTCTFIFFDGYCISLPC